MSLLTKHKGVKAGREITSRVRETTEFPFNRENEQEYPLKRKSETDDGSWEQCIASYLIHLKALGMAQRTYREAVYPLDQFRRYCQCNGVYDLVSVTEKDIVGYSKDELDKVKASTLVTKLLTLKGFFGYLAKVKVISYDVSLNIRVPRVGKSLPRDVLTPDDFVKLVGVIDTGCIHGFLYRVIIEVLYGTGIRISELCSLLLSDIDLDEVPKH